MIKTSPIATLEALSLGLFVTINRCRKVLKNDQIKTIAKKYEQYYQELSMSTLVLLLSLYSGSQLKTQEFWALLRAISSRLNEITELNELHNLTHQLYEIGYWSIFDENTNLFHRLADLTEKSEDLQNPKIISLTLKLMRCGVLPRKLLHQILNQVNNFEPFLQAQNKSEMEIAVKNFQPFEQEMNALLNIDYSLEMDFPEENLRLNPKIR